ncbi:TolC family protein, partial [Burkholderia sp. Ac-20379]|nr:TolC family protein [Burkholderia sp. Ac-20379]
MTLYMAGAGRARKAGILRRAVALTPLAVAALALAACTTVGPNYRVPKQALVNAPLADAP